MRLIIVLLLLISFSTAGQPIPDSIIIIQNTYVNSADNDNDRLHSTKSFPILLKEKHYTISDKTISTSKITRLLSAINNPNNINNPLVKYQIDTNWIKNNPSKILAQYPSKKYFAWNGQQKDSIYKKLTNIDNYRKELNNYLSSGRHYTMHQGYKNEYIIRIYTKGSLLEELKSRKHVWGYAMPWTNAAGDTLFNYDIEQELAVILQQKPGTKEPLEGKRLLYYLANRIIENNQRLLSSLSAYSYLQEIEELKSDFEVLSFEEVYGSGRYISNAPPTMKFRLRNNYMLSNVNLIFLASQKGKTIYSRDSLKKDYKLYISRIQSINFVYNYLSSHPNTRLDIYYFNNKGVNDYNIESINTNPKKWKKHDEYVRILEKYLKSEKDTTFEDNQARQISLRVDCGCNYRFDRGYLEKAIFFEIYDDTGNSSIWFLLPDDKVLLYIMDSEKTLNFTRADFNSAKEYGLIFPCALFDKNGTRIKK